MRITEMANNDVRTRYSLMRLGEAPFVVDIGRVDKFLREISQEGKLVAQEILRADRCMKFIEGIYHHKITVDSDTWIVALLTLYSNDMMSTSVLKHGFQKELDSLTATLKENIAKKYNPYQSAYNVLDRIVYCSLVKSHTLAAIYLITNMMLISGGKVLVLEDTDRISPDLLLDMQMVVKARV